MRALHSQNDIDFCRIDIFMSVSNRIYSSVESELWENYFKKGADTKKQSEALWVAVLVLLGSPNLLVSTDINYKNELIMCVEPKKNLMTLYVYKIMSR